MGFSALLVGGVAVLMRRDGGFLGFVGMAIGVGLGGIMMHMGSSMMGSRSCVMRSDSRMLNGCGHGCIPFLSVHLGTV